MLYVYIIPNDPARCKPGEPKYILSNPGEKKSIEEQALSWAKIEYCDKSKIQIIPLYIPEKKFKKHYDCSTYVYEGVIHSFLLENERHKEAALVPRPTIFAPKHKKNGDIEEAKTNRGGLGKYFKGGYMKFD
jgi:hypothetical protein